MDDPISRLLVEHAHLKMMDLYKPGAVEAAGDPITAFKISEEPQRTIKGTFGERRFYGFYKIVIPLKPAIPIADPNDVLQEDVITKAHTIRGNPDLSNSTNTLILYEIDFWITEQGEVWHESAEGLWTHTFTIPSGYLQGMFVKLRSAARSGIIYCPKCGRREVMVTIKEDGTAYRFCKDCGWEG